jgi:hypothetical protein
MVSCKSDFQPRPLSFVSSNKCSSPNIITNQPTNQPTPWL